MLAPFRARRKKPDFSEPFAVADESWPRLRDPFVKPTPQGVEMRRLIMAVNLVALVTQFLTPDLMARIASALGLDSSAAQKAIGGSIPAILAGMAGLASKPGGPQQLSNAVAQQPPGILDNLMNVVGGAGQKAFVDNGANMMSSLLGGSAMSALASGIGKFAGISGTTSSSLIGMLGPMVLGVLGKQQRSAGLDAGGLASLLTSQNDQIAAALPPGLANQLSGSGLMDALDRGAAAARGRVGEAADRASAGVSQAGHAMSNTASTYAPRSVASSWPLWVLAFAVLAGIVWFFAARDTDEKVAEQTQPRATQPAPAPRAAVAPSRDQTVGLATPDLMAGGVNLADQVNSSVAALRTTLAGITDATSAEAAVPRIRDAKAQLDRVSALAEQLPPDGKRALARLIAAAMPAINGMCDKVLAMPGAGNVARPVIDDLRVRLNSLASA
jgi:hypothetical protein